MTVINIDVKKVTCPFCEREVFPNIDRGAFAIYLVCPRCEHTIEVHKLKK